MKTMNDLFLHLVKDIYYAEKQILKALPKMVKAAETEELKEALENHRRETEGQVERLEQVFKEIDAAARGEALAQLLVLCHSEHPGYFHVRFCGLCHGIQGVFY